MVSGREVTITQKPFVAQDVAAAKRVLDKLLVEAGTKGSSPAISNGRRVVSQYEA